MRAVFRRVRSPFSDQIICHENFAGAGLISFNSKHRAFKTNMPRGKPMNEQMMQMYLPLRTKERLHIRSRKTFEYAISSVPS